MHMCVTVTSVKHAFSLTRFMLWRKISAWCFAVLVKDVLIGKADFCERNPIIDQVIPRKGHVEGVPGMICQFCLCGLVCCSCYMVSDAASNALAGVSIAMAVLPCSGLYECLSHTLDVAFTWYHSVNDWVPFAEFCFPMVGKLQWMWHILQYIDLPTKVGISICRILFSAISLPKLVVRRQLSNYQHWWIYTCAGAFDTPTHCSTSTSLITSIGG